MMTDFIFIIQQSYIRCKNENVLLVLQLPRVTVGGTVSGKQSKNIQALGTFFKYLQNLVMFSCIVTLLMLKREFPKGATRNDLH